MKLILFVLTIHVTVVHGSKWKFDEIHVREGQRMIGIELLNVAMASNQITYVNEDQVFTLKEDGAKPVNFELDKGRLLVNAQLDRETKNAYEMSLGVTNKNGDIIEEETTFTIVVDDLNDNPPKFAKSDYTLRLPEHSPLGTLAKLDDPVNKYIFATDADERSFRSESTPPCRIGTGNGDVTYKIVGQKKEWFALESCYDTASDQFIAKIRLNSANAAELDRENPPQLDFQLEARDIGAGGTGAGGTKKPFFTTEPVRVKIELDDINDNAPRFEQSEISVSVKENAPINSILKRIPVIDADSLIQNKAFIVSVQKDKLAMFYAEPSDDFTEVLLKHAKPLDYESQSQHQIVISIQSRDPLIGVKSIASTIQVKINVENVDEPPEFKKGTVVYVAENQPPNTNVANTKNLASDPENHGFSYEMVTGDVPFHLDPKSGEIKTSTRLDYESQSIYDIELLAKSDDGQLQGSGSVTIKVTDENDSKPRPSGTLSLTYCMNKPTWTGSVNFTDLDSSTQDLSVKEDRTDSSSQWNGLKLIPTFIASQPPTVSVTIQTDDPDRYIRSGMELPVIISDGKFSERFVITVQRCSCAAPNDGTKCDSLRAAAVPINAQIFWAVLIAVCFSLLTIIGFTFWRQSTSKKTTKSAYDSTFMGLEVDPEDKRDGVVEYNIESGEQDCTELISDMAVNACPKLSNIKEESIDIPKLKEKLKSISNPYFIAPYDSLQLYQYEGTNSVVSSLSSLNTCASETSLNLAALAAGGGNKMARLMKLFDSSEQPLGPSGTLRAATSTLGRPRFASDDIAEI